MKFAVHADANEETRVHRSKPFGGAAEFWFKDKDYGPGLNGVGVVITCRWPVVEQRVRLHKDGKEKWFDIDLMLDYNEIVKQRVVQQYSGQVSAKLFHADAEREQLIRQRIVREVPAVLRKYVTRKKDPLKDFDLDRFERDLRKCLLEGGLEEIMPEYNRHTEKALQGYIPPKDWRS